MDLGIIAEDHSDVAVIKELTRSLLRPHRIGFKPLVGHGCGKLRRKCRAYAENLVQRGCRWVAIVHDLDAYNERQLRNQLSNAIAEVRAEAKIVLIPKREIEAWLLYDAVAIATAFKEKKSPKLPGDPESLDDPKDFLTTLVWKEYRKVYLNTRHNEEIAQHIDIARLRRASSFAPYPTFVLEIRRHL